MDFIITKNQIPWMIIEIKRSQSKGLSQALYHFQSQTKAPYAFQVALEMDYVQKDCFEEGGPWIVPARTFLAQLA